MKNFSCAGWLCKSEPLEYSIHDLSRQTIGRWDGVRNYQARNFLKEMKLNDKVFFYHSNCSNPGIYGLMTVHKLAYPDPTAVDSKSKYYDAKAAAQPEKNPWVAVDMKIHQVYQNPLTLEEIKAFSSPALPENCRIIAKGNRLSVFPLSVVEWEILEKAMNKKNEAEGNEITRQETEVMELPTTTTSSSSSSSVAVKKHLEDKEDEEEEGNSRRKKRKPVTPSLKKQASQTSASSEVRSSSRINKSTVSMKEADSDDQKEEEEEEEEAITSRKRRRLKKDH